MQDLARAGRPPVVLLDSLRWLARYALTAPNPFTSVGDKRKLLALKQLYDSGKRPLRNKAGTKDPVLVSQPSWIAPSAHDFRRPFPRPWPCEAAMTRHCNGKNLGGSAKAVFDTIEAT